MKINQELYAKIQLATEINNLINLNSQIDINLQKELIALEQFEKVILTDLPVNEIRTIQEAIRGINQFLMELTMKIKN